MDSDLCDKQNSTSKEIEVTFELLREGEEKIKLSKSKDVVLILGNRGSGKSSFVQWIAGDNSKLISKETTEGSNEYIIVDESGRIGNSTIKSQTIFPELVIDPKTNTPLYDCSGFSDTRSTSYDVATTYFIKKLTDHANSLKLVFLLSYQSIKFRKVVDRGDFIELLRHATDLIKDVGKFSSSISIVVSKVDNRYEEKDGKMVLISDDIVIKSIADFFEEVKQDLKEKSKILTEENTFNEKAIKFIDILLNKKDKNYTRIGLFRRPDRPGPLSKIPLLQEGKKPVEAILNENLHFTKKKTDDFGYTISQKSKNDINELVAGINSEIFCYINEIAREMKKFYLNQIEQINNMIDFCAIVQKSFYRKIFETHQDPDDLTNDLFVGYEIVKNMTNEIKNLTDLKKLPEKIVDNMARLRIEIPESRMTNITNQAKYLDFMQVVSDKKLKIEPASWVVDFQNVSSYLFQSNEEIKSKSTNLANYNEKKLDSKFKSVKNTMLQIFIDKLERSDSQKLSNELKLLEDSFSKIKSEIETLDREKLVEKINMSLEDFDIDARMKTKNILYHEKCLKFAKKLSQIKFDIDSSLSRWFSDLYDDSKHFKQWVDFVIKVYKKLSEYEIQQDTSKYNVADLNDWGNTGKKQGIFINSLNFNVFLDKLKQYNIGQELENFKPSDPELKFLNDALDITLKHAMERSEQPDKLIIRGDQTERCEKRN